MFLSICYWCQALYDNRTVFVITGRLTYCHLAGEKFDPLITDGVGVSLNLYSLPFLFAALLVRLLFLFQGPFVRLLSHYSDRELNLSQSIVHTTPFLESSSPFAPSLSSSIIPLSLIHFMKLIVLGLTPLGLIPSTGNIAGRELFPAVMPLLPFEISADLAISSCW